MVKAGKCRPPCTKPFSEEPFVHVKSLVIPRGKSNSAGSFICGICSDASLPLLVSPLWYFDGGRE